MSQYHFEFRTIHAHLSKWDSWQPTPALCTCHSLSHWWHFSPVSWAFLSDSCLRTTFVSSLSFLFVFSSSASLFWKHFLRHHLFLSLLFMLAAWIPSPPTFLTRLKISVCVCVCVCVCARVFPAFVPTPTLNKNLALPDQLLRCQRSLSARTVPGF